MVKLDVDCQECDQKGKWAVHYSDSGDKHITILCDDHKKTHMDSLPVEVFDVKSLEDIFFDS